MTKLSGEWIAEISLDSQQQQQQQVDAKLIGTTSVPFDEVNIFYLHYKTFSFDMRLSIEINFKTLKTKKKLNTFLEWSKHTCVNKRKAYIM